MQSLTKRSKPEDANSGRIELRTPKDAQAGEPKDNKQCDAMPNLTKRGKPEDANSV